MVQQPAAKCEVPHTSLKIIDLFELYQPNGYDAVPQIRRRVARRGQDNRAPGLRPIHGADYYAAFIVDPDGYRIEANYGPGER
jgi:hypothetical protein